MKKWNVLLTAQTLSIALALGSLGSGCSAFRDMDSMTSNTSGMAQTTKDLAQKTGIVVSDSDTLKNTTAATYYGLRQGNGAEIRADMLKKMDQSTTVEGKISKATIYFEAFEFMLWTGTQEDTLALLDSQYLQAIQQFDREVTQYIPTDLKVDPTSKDNKMMNLYALSVTMHMTNENEINQPVLPNDDSSQLAPYHVSMFDLIKSSLRAEKAVYEGQMADSAETDWQQEGGANQQLFQALVQTRENFLSVMTLSKVSDIADSGFLGIPGLVREGKMLLAHWDSEVPSLNIDQLNQYDTWVVESNADRDFLKSISADASIDSSVLKIFSNMNQPGASALPNDASAGEKAAAQARTQAGNKLWNDIQNMIKG